MRKHLLISLLVSLACIALANAVPALPVKHLLAQPDGKTVTAYLRGDEFMHFYETADGLMLQKDSRGFYCYAELSGQGTVTTSPMIACDKNLRSAEDNNYIKGIKQEDLRNVLEKKMISERSEMKKAGKPGAIPLEFPTTGEVKGLVILAQYQDIKLSKESTVEAFDRVMNEENYDGPLSYGSVRDYFLAQSSSKLKLHFDVVGPVTLSKNRAYYGAKNEAGRENVSGMMKEAVKLAVEANPDIDFSQYDLNEDGYVDFVYVIYAGYGEAQGGPEETVWPQSGTLAYDDWTLYDDLYLGRYSCSCELSGKTGSNLDGIGTFCHEFSHILGLPDIYDTRYSGKGGLREWDIMDIGSYNDSSKTPSGYTALDRYSLGWLTPEILDGPQSVSLEALSSSNKAYFLVSETNPNEYYTFENRQNKDWDSALPSHGLLVCRVLYDKSIWKTNMVNTATTGDHVKLISTDPNKDLYMEDGDARDVFPGIRHYTEFTDETNPAMKWNSGDKVGKPITNIQEKDGVITFDFRNPSGIESYATHASFAAYSDDQSIVVSNENSENIAIYTITGQLIYMGEEVNCRVAVANGCYIVHIGKKTCKVNVR